MAESMPEDMWTPYKYLNNMVEKYLNQPNKTALSQLESILRKHTQNFINILRNPPKNSTSRSQIKQGMVDGINIPGTGHTILPKDLVDECIILSNMYDLEEYIALELLCTAQQQMHHHPGLPRGLVAVLLYYDGKKALACTLRDLFQTRSGVSWCAEAPEEITQFITSYTNDLVKNSNLLDRLIELLEQLDVSEHLDILAANRALGPPKHHRQVLDLFEDTRLALATALFNWAAQSGLPSSTSLKLINYLKNYKPTEARGGMDDVTVTLLMALLYSFDTSVMQKYEDGEVIIHELPIIKEAEYSQKIYKEINFDANKDIKWEWDDKIRSIINFAFGLSMSSLRQAPHNLQKNSLEIIEKDEELIDDAINNRVFDFIHYYLLENEIIFKTEFFFRRIHVLFTDFIELMHSKVTELRSRADETARTVQSYMEQAIDPPSNLDHSFESLMLAVGKFYAGDQLNLCLSLEYWGPMDIPTNYAKSSSRSVSLFKFLRSAGEVLPPILFVPYLKMLAGLSSCQQSARNTFNLLKQGSYLSGSSTTLSWDHFFGSLNRYYTNLRQEQQPRSETVYRNRVLNRSIKPVEIEGLHAVFEVIRSVAKYDEIARIALCEHPNWSTINILLGLLSCSVPITLKADILSTLSMLAKSKDNAIKLWNSLEASQIIVTLPTTSSYVKVGLEAEIEQIESRNESYPLSKAVLDLLYELSKAAIPKNLGSGTRKPGLDPYITFIIDRIFLKFYSRNYKNMAEKWEIGEKCLKIFYFFIKSYDINPLDFNPNREDNPPSGFYVMLQMHTPSEILRLMLLILDEARIQLDNYSSFLGKSELEQCVLHCLNVIERTLLCRDLYFDAHSAAHSLIPLLGLNKLLMNVNPRSGKSDHLLNITKFVTYNSWLPAHALIAIKILTYICKTPNINPQLLAIFTQNETIQNEIRYGFVECLENDFFLDSKKVDYDNENDVSDDNELNNLIDEFEFSLKEAVLNLLQETLPQSAPNIAHYLLGFEITKDIRSTQLQKPGVLNFPSTCTKSLITILDNNLDRIKNEFIEDCNQTHERVIDKAYRLLFTLCYNHRTSEVILRFLRSCSDFLCRHVSTLPFPNYDNSLVLSQMSNLLKCVAIELKITAENNQISQFSHLCGILLGVNESSGNEGIGPLELNYYSSAPTTTTVDTLDLMGIDCFKKQRVKGDDVLLLICHLLECLDFESKTIECPKWNYFDNSMTKQILKECQLKNDNGSELINIKKLHDVLYEELNIVQNTIAAGQRQLILQEIQCVLMYALKLNEQKRKCTSTVKFMEAWGQVTQIVFNVSPIIALPFETKEELITKILQSLLNKILPIQVILEIATISSATVLLLLVNLRRCYDFKQMMNEHNLQSSSNDVITAISRLSNRNFHSGQKSNISSLSLKFILKNIIEWIIFSGVSSQYLRVNLYASLLNFMHILKGPQNIANKDDDDDDQYVSRLDRSILLRSSEQHEELNSDFANRSQIAVEIFTSYGDKLFDILCHDCIGSHDICKMLALSCIDNLLEFDELTCFTFFIAKRGYLAHLIDSLIKSDESLCKVLNSVPESNSMRSLYVYESKMAMLNRIASSQIGAEIILEQNIISVLSNMKVYDLHPDFQVNLYAQKMNLIDLQILPVDNRYQQILFPALSFCNVILSTLGSNHISAISQIIHFILSHGDTIEIVLRAGKPSLNLGLLKELAGITGLIARTTNQEIISESNLSSKAVNVQLYRLQRLMLALFPRFFVNDLNFKEVFKPENSLQESPEKQKLHLNYFLETAANLALYCRNSIVNHSTDQRTTRILFAPTVIDSLQKNESRNGSMEISPSLGIVVTQLKNCVESYNKEKPEYDNLICQKSSILKDNLNKSAQSHYCDLILCLNNKRTELSYYTFITEQCLYLIWAHLDFYMRRAIPMNTLQFTESQSGYDTFISSPTEAGWKITADDISNLKKSLILIFNETFCKQLVQTASSQAVADKGFIEALLRRIKCLIQFVPVD